MLLLVSWVENFILPGSSQLLVKANTKAAHKKQKDPAAVWGTAYSTEFEFPTADPIISKTGLRVRLPEWGCLTEDTMIKLAEEQQQKHSDEVMRIATNRADAKRKVAEKEREMIKTRVSNCMEWIIRKLEKAEMAEVKKKGKARGRGKSNKTPSGAGKRKARPDVADSSTPSYRL